MNRIVSAVLMLLLVIVAAALMAPESSATSAMFVSDATCSAPSVAASASCSAPTAATACSAPSGASCAGAAEHSVVTHRHVFRRSGPFMSRGPVRRLIAAPFRLFGRWRAGALERRAARWSGRGCPNCQ